MERNKLIEDNMKLVYLVLNKYFPSLKIDDDLVQSGMIGLIQAANTWDETESKFSTYACICIKRAIYRELRSRKKHYGIRSLDYDITLSTGEVVPVAETIVGEDGVDFVDFTTFYEKLSPKYKIIVDYRLEGLTGEEIGQKLGCSRQRVNQLLTKIKKIWEKTNGNQS